jgi:hypothetical protein
VDGIWGVLWCARTLRFVGILLSKLGSAPGMSISAGGRATYAEVLQPYHAPVMAWVVGTVVGWAPSRAKVLSSTLQGLSNEEASSRCVATAAELLPLAEALLAHVAAAGMDYPDKISTLPFGL